MSEQEKKNNPSFLKNKSYSLDNMEELMIPDEPQRFSGKDVERILIHAAESGVSDISLQSNLEVNYKLYSENFRVTKHKLETTELKHFIEHIHGESGPSTLNGGKALDEGYFVKDKDNEGRTYRYRVNSTKERQQGQITYQVTARVIPTEIPYLKDMDLPDDLKEALLTFKKGIALITGATGSGKSTLLASIIGEFLRNDKYTKKILTAEAPIEFDYSVIKSKRSFCSQSQIPDDLKTFAKATENALRRAPDIILIGESRDPETIGEAVIASMTGHEVYTTVHSNGFADTIRRMVDVFPENAKAGIMAALVSSVKIVLSQMLVPSTDGKRVALREYVIINDDIKDILLNGGVDKLTYTSKKVLKDFGHSFLQDAKEKFAAGRISKEVYESIEKMTLSKEKLEDEQALKENTEIEILKSLKFIQEQLLEQAKTNNLLISKMLDNNERLKLLENNFSVERKDDLDLGF